MSADYVRVKDKATGHEFSTRKPVLSKVEVLDKPAVDRGGRRLAAKPKISVAKKASAKTVASPAEDPTPKEGSA